MIKVNVQNQTPVSVVVATDVHLPVRVGSITSVKGGIDVSGASVGQIVKIAAVDDAGKPTAWEAVDLPEQVQADWNQNDSTAADYVKNRTHYTKMDTVLEYGVLSGF